MNLLFINCKVCGPACISLHFVGNVKRKTRISYFFSIQFGLLLSAFWHLTMIAMAGHWNRRHNKPNKYLVFLFWCSPFTYCLSDICSLLFGRNDAKAETPVLWPPNAKSWLIGKDSDARRDWRQEEKGTTEDEMAAWHHWLNGRESEWTPGDGDGQGGLACCDSWGCKESDTTERLNWTELNWWLIHVDVWQKTTKFCKAIILQ